MTIIKNRFDNCLESQQTIIIDGGLGTQLEAQGCKLDSLLWSAHVLRDNPQAIIDAHLAFFESGASCAISASYQATEAGFMSLGMNSTEAQALIVKSVDLAIAAREVFYQNHPDHPDTLLVAASIGPYGASLGDGSEYTGAYGVTDQAIVEFHKNRLALLDQSDADILACETIPSLQEAKVLHALLMEVETPVWVTFSCKDGQHLNDGTKMTEIAELFNGHPKVRAIGINCTSPAYINELISQIKMVDPEQTVVVYPNSGETYHAADNSWSGTTSPTECGEAAHNWHKSGANIIGGCCRMGPDHIESIKRYCQPVTDQ